MIPIRTRLTVLRDGSTATSSSVFCERRRCSVRPGSCVRCGARVANDVDGRASVECPWSARPPVPAEADPWSVTASRPAGLALTRRVVCIMADAPLSSASTASRHLRELLVVDVHREIVGVLRDIDALQVVAAARRACA